MDFKNLEEVHNTWVSGKFGYPPQITIANIVYKFRSSPNQSFEDVVISGTKGYIIYGTSTIHKQEAKAAGLEQWIVFVWGTDSKSNIKPYDVRGVAPHRFVSVSNGLTEQTEVLGDVAIIRINLPSGNGAIKGKVDTGAEISSLHADRLEVNNGMVKFTNSEISDSVITVPMAEKQAVSSADGGVEYRPVVVFDIEINGKPVSKVQFNLNDRSKMEYPCLVGQNILDKTNFMINPRQNGIDENIDDDGWLINEDVEAPINYEALHEEFKDIIPDEELMVSVHEILSSIIDSVEEK